MLIAFVLSPIIKPQKNILLMPHVAASVAVSHSPGGTTYEGPQWGEGWGAPDSSSLFIFFLKIPLNILGQIPLPS